MSMVQGALCEQCGSDAAGGPQYELTMEGSAAAPAAMVPGSAGIDVRALWDEQLDQALDHPAAPSYDEVSVATMRRSRAR